MEEKKFDKYEYDRKYHAEHYCRFGLALPKEMKEVIEKAAADAGMSRNAFIKSAIEEKIARLG